MKALSKAITDHYEDASKAAGQAVRDFDPAAIHRFRVAMKQLKATLNLLLFVNPKALKSEDWKAARKIFRQAGKVRENQLLKDRMAAVTSARADPGKKVSDFLAKQERAARQKLKRNFKSRGERDLKRVRRKMLKAADEISAESMKEYFDDLLKRINELKGKDEMSVKEMHGLRMLLKELKYNRSVAEEDLLLHFEGNFQPDKLDEWEEIIGKWHDEVIFAENGQKLIEQMQAEGELKAVIDEMKDHSAKNADSLLHEITEKFPPGSDGFIRLEPAASEEAAQRVTD